MPGISTATNRHQYWTHLSTNNPSLHGRASLFLDAAIGGGSQLKTCAAGENVLSWLSLESVWQCISTARARIRGLLTPKKILLQIPWRDHGSWKATNWRCKWSRNKVVTALIIVLDTSCIAETLLSQQCTNTTSLVVRRKTAIMCKKRTKLTFCLQCSESLKQLSLMTCQHKMWF